MRRIDVMIGVGALVLSAAWAGEVRGQAGQEQPQRPAQRQAQEAQRAGGQDMAGKEKMTSARDVLTKLHKVSQKEIEMGRAVQERAQSPQVRQFAEMLVRDHREADQKITEMARRMNVDLETARGRADEEMTRLRGMRGQELERTFLTMQAREHQRLVSDLRSARERIDDQQVRQLIDQMIPTLEKHQQVAQVILAYETQGRGARGANGANGEGQQQPADQGNGNHQQERSGRRPQQSR